MQKFLLGMVAILLLVHLVGCVPITSTGRSNDHIYTVDEEIRVFENNTGDELGFLKITNIRILLDKKFQSKVADGYDDDGIPKYKTEEYSRVVQVFYSYDFGDIKKLGNKNFWLNNNDGVRIDIIEPRPDFNEYSEQDRDSVIFALRNVDSSVILNFNYNFEYQTNPTAKIRIIIQ